MAFVDPHDPTSHPCFLLRHRRCHRLWSASADKPKQAENPDPTASQCTHAYDNVGEQPQQQRPTAFLDGLRGFAAVIVCICHYTENNFPFLLPHWGTPDWGQESPSKVSRLQFPILRVIFSGRSMVHIFFVVSGMSLSYRPLQEIRRQNYAGLNAAISSAALRRPLRLFGAPIIETFLIVVLVEVGLLYQDDMKERTLQDILRRWVDGVHHNIAWPWSWDRHLWPPFDVHLWTIPIELCHSMLLFIHLVILSRIRTTIRLGLSVGFMLYCLCNGKWAAFEFIGGSVLAEWLLLRMEDEHAGREESRKKTECPLIRWAMFIFYVVALVAFLLVAGWPNQQAALIPGFRQLTNWAPRIYPHEDDAEPQKFWFAPLALLAVWSCGQISPVRRLLESRTGQKAGRISFAIYMVHGPMLDMLQYIVLGSGGQVARGKPFSEEYQPAVAGTGIRGWCEGGKPGRGQTEAWFIGLLMLGTVAMAAAEAFVKVDEMVVRMAKTLETWCLAPESQKPTIQPPENRDAASHDAASHDAASHDAANQTPENPPTETVAATKDRDE